MTALPSEMRPESSMCWACDAGRMSHCVWEAHTGTRVQAAMGRHRVLLAQSAGAPRPGGMAMQPPRPGLGAHPGASWPPLGAPQQAPRPMGGMPPQQGMMPHQQMPPMGFPPQQPQVPHAPLALCTCMYGAGPHTASVLTQACCPTSFSLPAMSRHDDNAASQHHVHPSPWSSICCTAASYHLC